MLATGKIPDKDWNTPHQKAAEINQAEENEDVEMES